MNPTRFGFEVEGIVCYRDGVDPARFHAVPRAPSTSGAVSFMPIPGSGAMLGLSAVWTIDSATLASVGSTLATRLPAKGTTVVAVGPGEVVVDRMRLDLVGSDGDTKQLATSPTSGYPPFTAALSATIAQADVPRVRAAVSSGAAGVLVLTLRYALEVVVTATATISGDVFDVYARGIDARTEMPTPESVGTLLDAAIGEGRVAVVSSGEPDVPGTAAALDATVAQARSSAVAVLVGDVGAIITRKRAVEAARSTTKPTVPSTTPAAPAGSRFTAGASTSTTIRIPSANESEWLESTTDLGPWLAANRPQGA